MSETAAHLCAKADARTKPSPAGPKPLPGVVTMSHFCRICVRSWSTCQCSPTSTPLQHMMGPPGHHHIVLCHQIVSRAYVQSTAKIGRTEILAH